MGRLDGKVAFITGAGRGQGRAHALRLAEEGADIIALDILEDIPGLAYPMATMADRDETVAKIEAMGRRIVFEKADVRDLDRLHEVAAQGVAELGSIDIVLANAGAGSPGVSYEMSEDSFTDTIDRFLTSTWRTIRAVAPLMIEAGRGGSIILTSSTSGLVGVPGMAHYVAAKHGVTGLMKACAIDLGPFDIRVNAIASTTVNTPMIQNPAIRAAWTGDPDSTDEQVVEVMSAMHILDVPWVEPVDISHAVLWLASDEARFITGATIPVDAGALAPFTIPHGAR
ncbi:mycofactocin-coupled SDR family oxidoreductase [Aeromicrobium endophyticum]|uniref:NAD(P)-dependent oxidoreductase n=1 Tax=Aeromicrobium endophyticum TaxID=2292704 RepID=A0A371PDW2_9ACTN|nr:mycofactocin-coupled SDR family oxidoreductase [Aeromicrobium endophyticum]REK73698.1 NAD(P)-dependent oxidoreductase [Aeromicrobium endophyticum]